MLIHLGAGADAPNPFFDADDTAQRAYGPFFSFVDGRHDTNNPYRRRDSMEMATTSQNQDHPVKVENEGVGVLTISFPGSAPSWGVPKSSVQLYRDGAPEGQALTWNANTPVEIPSGMQAWLVFVLSPTIEPGFNNRETVEIEMELEGFPCDGFARKMMVVQMTFETYSAALTVVAVPQQFNLAMAAGSEQSETLKVYNVKVGRGVARDAWRSETLRNTTEMIKLVHSPTCRLFSRTHSILRVLAGRLDHILNRRLREYSWNHDCEDEHQARRR